MLWCYHSNETSSTVRFVVSFIQYAVLTFESVDEILWCDHSNETSPVLSLDIQINKKTCKFPFRFYVSVVLNVTMSYRDNGTIITTTTTTTTTMK